MSITPYYWVGGFVVAVAALFEWNSDLTSGRLHRGGASEYAAGVGEDKDKGKLIFAHSSYQDFSAGDVSNSGQNLFVSKDGQIRNVNWFDFNNDGYPEIFVSNDHNNYENVPGFIYYNQPNRGFRSLTPPVEEDMPGFQQLEWQLESLKSMARLTSLGGGTSEVNDLNGDGYPEIIFSNFVHGWSYEHFPAFLYWGGPEGYSRDRMLELPTLGGSSLTAADLNGDGLKDLVVANSGREYEVRKPASERNEKIAYDESRSFIYWQKPYGFTIEDRLEIPTAYALDVRVADFNKDNYPDLVFLQSGENGSIRLYYGGAGGIDKDRFEDIEVLAPNWSGFPRKLLVADLDDNGWPDVFVPSEGTVSEIFWNGEEGFSAANVRQVESHNTHAAEAADLNKDGHTDLIIANYTAEGSFEIASWVYWGSEQGFSAEHRTDLPTLGASGVKATDLNQDGYADLIFSHHRNNETFDVPAYIYWGSAEGFHVAQREKLAGFGAVDVSVADFNKDGREDVFLMNRQSGRAKYVPMNAYVYWGNQQAHYSTNLMSSLPGVSPEATLVATDLDGNGHADMIYTNQDGTRVNVFYGNNGAFASNHRATAIPFHGHSVVTADLDKDGFLDVVVGSLTTNEIALFHGGEQGLSEPDIFEEGIPHYTASLGDLNSDGRLDLVLGGRGEIKIIFADENGMFAGNRHKTIKTNKFTTRISLADFNNDGLLDIFGHHFHDEDTWRNNILSAIYWNKGGAFSFENKLTLPTHGAHAGSVADLNEDGQLDILIANYHGEKNRHVPTFVYWGQENGKYSQENRKLLPAFSSSGNMVLDLDGNGYNDVIVYNHSESNVYAGLRPKGGVHGTGSYIYWGTENGWDVDHRSWISSFGPHNRLNADPGDIMRRKSYETYTSAPVTGVNLEGNFTLEIEADANFRQNIEAFVRTGTDVNSLKNQNWIKLTSKESSGEKFTYEGEVNQSGTVVQYKLHLDAGGTGNGPVIQEVKVYGNQSAGME